MKRLGRDFDEVAMLLAATRYDRDTGKVEVFRSGVGEWRPPSLHKQGGHLEFGASGGLPAFLAHTAAWVHCYQVLPAGPIFHMNRDKTDNRHCNLRSSPFFGWSSYDRMWWVDFRSVGLMEHSFFADFETAWFWHDACWRRAVGQLPVGWVAS
jgi:hypothetical protein